MTTDPVETAGYCGNCGEPRPVVSAPRDRGVETASVNRIMQTHRPGSGDWTWEQEFADLRDRDGAALEALRRGVAVVGIREPLLLGDDGRVWDGHHRLLVAVDLGIERVPIRWGRSGPVAGSPVHEGRLDIDSCDEIRAAWTTRCDHAEQRAARRLTRAEMRVDARDVRALLAVIDDLVSAGSPVHEGEASS